MGDNIDNIYEYEGMDYSSERSKVDDDAFFKIRRDAGVSTEIVHLLIPILNKAIKLTKFVCLINYPGQESGFG